jgi:hypothetical protein
MGLVLNYFGALYDTSDDLGNKCSIQGTVFNEAPATNLHYVKALLASCILLIPDTTALGIAKYDFFHFLLYLIIITYLVRLIITQEQHSLFTKIIFVCLLFFMVAPLIIRPQYTNTAGLLAMILVLFLRESSFGRTFKYFIIGFLLIFVGYALRKEMFLTIFVIFTPILFVNIPNRKKLPSINFKSLSWVILIFISSIGVIEIYERFVGTPTEIESRKNTMHLKFSKIFDYGYTSKLRKPSNHDVFKSSGLSENDLDLVSNRFYWQNIDTLLPKIERAINEITARQSKMSRLLTVKFSFQYLFTKELAAYTLSLILLLMYAAMNIGFRHYLPYLLSFILFLVIIFTYGWIQRYSYTRLFYAPLISLIVILLYQTRNFKGSLWIQAILVMFFLVNAVSALQVHQSRLIDAKENSLKVHRANLKYDSLVDFGGKINFEYLYPPFPLKGCQKPPKMLITSPIPAVTRLNQGSKELFLSDSSSLGRLNIFSQEHFNKKLKLRMINKELGIYEVSMDSLSYYN